MALVPPGVHARQKMLAVLLGGQFLANVDTAIANVATPSIRAGLGASAGASTLVVSAYIVAFAVLMVPGARLGATHGRRRTFLIGLALFTAASLACGLAPDVGTLIGARFGQGAGAALMVPQVLSSIQLYFRDRARSSALAWYAVTLSGGAVAGQVAGGLLVSADLFGTAWRPVFLVNVLLGLPLLAAARRVLPPDDVAERQRLDLHGAALLAIAVVLVIVPLSVGRDEHWPPWTWGAPAAGIVVFGRFVVVERALEVRPLISPALLRNTVVRCALLAYSLTSLTYLALLYVLALYLQQGLGKSAAYSGLAMVSWVAAFGVGGPLLARLPTRVRRWGPVAGCLILAAGYAGLGATLPAGGPALFALLGVGGLGLGVSANSLISTMASATPDAYAADLSGVITTAAQLAGALGVAVAGTVYAVAAFTVVLMGFTVLALAGAAAAGKAVR